MESEVLRRWNELPEEGDAALEVLPCCGSRAWAHGMAARRPLRSADEVMRAAADVWRGLGESDWMEAFSSHPRLGERHAEGAVTARSLAWSSEEQSAAGASERAAREALREGNARYEQRFGRIFLLCARGRSAEEMTRELERRMANDDRSEMLEAVEQQRQITALRLERWMNGG